MNCLMAFSFQKELGLSMLEFIGGSCQGYLHVVKIYIGICKKKSSHEVVAISRHSRYTYVSSQRHDFHALSRPFPLVIHTAPS